MATHTFTAVPNSAANQNWMPQVSAALDAIGVMKTADTGQIDMSTVSGGTANGVVSGYEIRAFSDALQATHPIVFKIEYGTITNGYPSFFLTVGKGSDGDGNITGILKPRGWCTGAVSETQEMTGYASSGDGSMCALFPFSGGNHRPTYHLVPQFVIDRSRDSTGAPTGDGVTVAIRGTASVGAGAESASNTGGDAALWAFSYATGDYSFGAPPVAVPWSVNGATLNPGAGIGGGVLAPVFPWTCFAPGIAPWQPLAAVSYAGSDVGPGVMTVRLAGQDRTYRFIGLTHTGSWGQGVDPTASSGLHHRAIGIGILWE